LNKSIFFLLSALAPFGWADSPIPPDATLPAGWQTQCFGRVQFSMPGSQGWFDQQTKPPEPYKGHQTTPAIWRGEYGRDPLHPDKVLVQIAVSRAASLDYWKRDTSYFRPSRGEAQERVIQRRLDEIKARKITLLSDHSEEAETLYSQLREEERALEDAQQHIGKVSTDILWVSEAIEDFMEQGKDTAQLEAKLAGLMIEDAKYPVDDLFEQEYFVELNRPNALAISGPYDFSASLWENGRIYTFQFGMQHNQPRSEQKSLEPAALDFLARFRARPEHEIPNEPGVCLPFGFIATLRFPISVAAPQQASTALSNRSACIQSSVQHGYEAPDSECLSEPAPGQPFWPRGCSLWLSGWKPGWYPLPAKRRGKTRLASA